MTMRVGAPFGAIAVMIVLVATAASLRADTLSWVQSDAEMYTRSAHSEDIGGGFVHHGMPVNVPYRRGLVSTHNGEGQGVVLIWLRGDAILEVNVETGAYHQHEPPFSSGQSPFASLLSSQNRYYSSFGGHFAEFDPEAGRFTFAERVSGRTAMCMVEDDDGYIWAAHAREVQLVRFDPRNRELRDYGPLYDDPERRRHPRSIAADDSGWIYVLTGRIAFDRETEQATTFLDEDQDLDLARLWRYDNGKVYSQVRGSQQWVEIHKGQATVIDHAPEATKVYGTYKARMDGHFVSGTQGLMHRELPNGERVKELNMDHGRLLIEDAATGDTREVQFEVADGAGVRSVLAAPFAAADDLIAGIGVYPHRFWAYEPRGDTFTVGPVYGQWNVSAVTDDGVVYSGIYTAGAMLEWNPSKPWVPTERGDPESNPRYLDGSRGHPHLWRPTDLLVYPGDRYVVHASWSTESQHGGGLAIWDRHTQSARILTHEDLIPEHDYLSVAPLGDGRLLVGATPQQYGWDDVPGDAKLCVIHIASGEMQWHEAPVEGIGRYREMVRMPNGHVLILADQRRVFVFDPETRGMVREIEVPEAFGDAAGGGGSGTLAWSDDGRLFVFFQNAIAQVDPQDSGLTKVAQTPGRARRAGAYLDGRIYFTADLAHLYSWEVPPAE